ncbi:hypothetical protein GCM10020258_10150 [Sphingomonas yabuuchiae]
MGEMLGRGQRHRQVAVGVGERPHRQEAGAGDMSVLESASGLGAVRVVEEIGDVEDAHVRLAGDGGEVLRGDEWRHLGAPRSVGPYLGALGAGSQAGAGKPLP